MKLLADECCDGGLVAALRADGHDVLFAAESLRGLPDAQVLDRAFREGRLLLTEDRDFGELIHRLRLPAHGVIFLRFSVEQHTLKASRVKALLDTGAERLQGTFAVLEPDRIRLRPLSD